MVFGFVVLSNVAAEKSLAVSQFFTPVGNDVNRKSRTSIIVDSVLLRVSRESSVLDDNLSEFKGFVEKSKAPLGNGIFRLPQDELFDTPKIVLFHSFQRCCFALIMEEEENRAAGLRYLTNIYHFLSTRWKESNISITDVSKRNEDVISYNHYFMPCGQLLLVRADVERNLRVLLEKDIAATPKK